MALTPGTRLGVYEVTAQIGVGGMGEVYQAKDARLKRDVALKVLPAAFAHDADRLARFQREAELLATLNHPNIAAIYGLEEANGVRALVLELVEGPTLADRIAKGPIPLHEVLPIARQIAMALEAAHEKGVIHRDLKPANIKIAPNGMVKVLDFGLAKIDDAAAPDLPESPTVAVRGTRAGVILGTAAYMSPEQARGRAVDKRTDIWAFGCVLYEMASGQATFARETVTDTLAAIIERDPAWNALPSQTPADIILLLRRCLEKDPQRRARDVASVRREIEDVLAASAPPRTLGPSSVRRRAPVAAIFSVAVVAAIVATVSIYRTRAPRAVAGMAPSSISTPTTPADRITLAVLPFEAQSIPEDIRFLGIGIPDAIITRLANIGKVLPRPTSAILRYENQNKDAKEVGHALASEYVLTGIVHEAGERLRVSVQLVRVNDGTPLWGKPYDVVRADVLGLQDTIAEQVAEALDIQLTAEERARVYRRFTSNVAAYELYLQGRSRVWRYTAEDTRAAVKAFESALRLDSNYVLARAGVALSSAYMRLFFAPEIETTVWGERAEREARAALNSEPNLAEAHEALAAVYRAVEFDWGGTIEESRRALELNPNLDQPHYYRASAFWHLGLFELAELEVRRGEEINPANRADPLRQRGIAALFTGRFHKAIPLLRDVQQITTGHASDYLLGQAYYYDGERTRGEEVLADLHGTTPADRRAQAVLASLLAARADTTQAEALLRTLTGGGFVDHHVMYSLGVAHLHLGDRTTALKWLRQAAETGLTYYPWYQQDPLLDPFRSDPGFRQFLEDMRSSWESAKEKYQRESR